MSKRINELKYLASKPSIDNPDVSYVDHDKFAELLMQDCITECMKHVVGSVHSHAAANNNAVGRCVDSIKKILE